MEQAARILGQPDSIETLEHLDLVDDLAYSRV
jgi:hypothetical protein